MSLFRQAGLNADAAGSRALDRIRAPCCPGCALSEACRVDGVGPVGLSRLHMLARHLGPYQAGEHLFREGQPFNAIAVIRAGTVKGYVVDREGREHVLGFHLAGEVVGMNAVDAGIYPCNAIALDNVTLCRFSYPGICTLATQVPELQQHLFRLMSRDIARASLLAGDWSADQRLAGFLVSLSRRLSVRGIPPTRFRLSMARTDIANYLRLAPETVSRVFQRFRRDGLLHVDRRQIEFSAPGRLDALAAPVLGD